MTYGIHLEKESGFKFLLFRISTNQSGLSGSLTSSHVSCYPVFSIWWRTVMTQQDRNWNWLVLVVCALATAGIAALLLFGGGSISMRGVLASCLVMFLYKAVRVFLELRSSGS